MHTEYNRVSYRGGGGCTLSTTGFHTEGGGGGGGGCTLGFPHPKNLSVDIFWGYSLVI